MMHAELVTISMRNNKIVYGIYEHDRHKPNNAPPTNQIFETIG